jgi:3-oxoacyl-[acyl-carrier-protein] synthase II
LNASSTPAPHRRRVVVTGLGAVTPIGNNRADFWQRLIAGESGVAPITAFDATDFATRIAAEVKDFRPDELLGRKEARRMDRFTQFAVVAAREAIEDANLPDDSSFKERTGAVLGTGIGGIITFWLNAEKAKENGTWAKVTPFFIPMLMANAEAAHISMQHGFKGPVFSAASACASANDAIVTAYNYIAYGDADAMITGGSEATVSPLAIGGFASMRAMSTRNDDPTRASRPFDRERDGFVLGEGAGVLVLEEYESAKARGAKIYCEILGYGQSADAYDLVAVDPDGSGVMLALTRAFVKAGIEPQDVDYINAHGTSTPIGDAAETRVIKIALGEENAASTPVSSTKGATGHCLGAAGAVEAVFAILAVHDSKLPPTINYEHSDPECDLDYVPNESRDADVPVALSNSFGFGGHNACIVIKRFMA